MPVRPVAYGSTFAVGQVTRIAAELYAVALHAPASFQGRTVLARLAPGILARLGSFVTVRVSLGDPIQPGVIVKAG